MQDSSQICFIPEGLIKWRGSCCENVPFSLETDKCGQVFHMPQNPICAVTLCKETFKLAKLIIFERLKPIPLSLSPVAFVHIDVPSISIYLNLPAFSFFIKILDPDLGFLCFGFYTSDYTALFVSFFFLSPAFYFSSYPGVFYQTEGSDFP